MLTPRQRELSREDRLNTSDCFVLLTAPRAFGAYSPTASINASPTALVGIEWFRKIGRQSLSVRRVVRLSILSCSIDIDYSPTSLFRWIQALFGSDGPECGFQGAHDVSS